MSGKEDFICNHFRHLVKEGEWTDDKKETTEAAEVMDERLADNK